MKNSTLSTLLASVFIALGIAAAGYFIGQTMYNSKVALNTAEAKGLAERRVTADLASWQLYFRVTDSATTDIKDLYAEAERRQTAIVTMLKESGFSDAEVTSGVIDYRLDEYRDSKGYVVDSKHLLSGSISVETTQVALVAKVRSSVNQFIAQGYDIDNQEPMYRFTKLNDIKPELLREATKNARLAANEFAENAGVTVGGIRNARQGNFFIRDAGQEYGDTRKIEKDVRVVTTITFYLTE